jgi:hypothetical protein
MLIEPRTADRYRVVERATIVEELTRCWGYDVRAGDLRGVRARAERAIEELHDFGLPRPDPALGRCYDPAEVLNFLRVAGEAGACAAWDDAIALGRRMVSEMGGTRVTSGRQPFTLYLRREFNARHLPRSGRARLRLPGPADLAGQKASIEVDVKGGLAFSVAAPAPGRIEVVLDEAPAEGTIVVESRIDFEAQTQGDRLASAAPTELPPELTQEERALYLLPREGLVVVSPRIAAMARELAAGARDEREILRRLWSFTAELEFGYLHYDRFDPLDPLGGVLGAGWVNCHVGAAFLAALCRACQIPARVLAGYCLHPVDPFYHFWTEVYLRGRGWVPLDLAGVSLTAHARAQQLPADLAPRRPTVRRSLDEAWRDVFFGKLDFRLVTECFPRVFTGNVGLRWPSGWYMSTGFCDGLSERRYHALADGSLLYRDLVAVQTEPAPWGDIAPQCRLRKKRIEVEA